MKASIDGLDEVRANLEKVGKAVKKKLLRKAMTAIGQEMLKVARSRVSVRRGWLKKSLAKKIATYAAATVAIVGPQTGFKRIKPKGQRSQRVRTKFGAKLDAAAAGGKPIKPSKYAHLAERKKPFIRPALDFARTRGLKMLADIVREGVAAELAGKK